MANYLCLGDFNPLNLEAGVASKMTSEECEESRKLLIAKWRENIEKCLSATDADLIVASDESALTSVAMTVGLQMSSAFILNKSFRPCSTLFYHSSTINLVLPVMFENYSMCHAISALDT